MMLLPDSFGNLMNLQHIDLSGALSLQMLPNSFGNLTQLRHLELRGCCSLTISNETFGKITTLEHIGFSGCSNVNELPPQVAHQRSLQKLDVCKTNLKKLPSGLEDISKFEVLEFGGQPSFEMLPTLLGWYKGLKELWLFDRPELKRLPDSFGLLTQLVGFNIWNCGIEYLPQDLMGMKNLEFLSVEDCPLRELPFTKAEGESDFSDHKCMLKLKRLQLVRTQISEVFFHEGVCPNLQYLFLEGCFELRGIGGLCRLAKLQYLYVSSCEKLEALPGVEEHLRSLDESEVSENPYLNQLQRAGRLTNAIMYLNKCREILEAGGLSYLMYRPRDRIRI
jgi:Leucine-rich repeat (LRR) protein